MSINFGDKELRREFNRRIEKIDGCWLWTGAVNRSGHAVWNLHGTPEQLCKRIAWMLYVEDLEKGLQLKETCGNKRCCNPKHHIKREKFITGSPDPGRRGRRRKKRSLTKYDPELEATVYSNLHLREMDETIVNFLSKVKVVETCWEWQGKRDYGGYGYFGSVLLSRRAHRASFQMFKGEIPEGDFVLHECDNPSCVNPEHLKLGDYLQNQKDKINRHRFSGSSTEEEVRAIRRLAGEGYATEEIKNMIGLDIGVASINRIIHHRTWKFIT